MNKDIAIMQPYFMPYIGYWQLINAVDTFVLYDNIQFSKKSWFHRNYFLLNGQKKLFSIPLKKDIDNLNVADRFLANDSQTQIKKILAQIENNYRKAPYFNNVFFLIKSIFKYNEKNLFKYIYNSIIQICDYLDLETRIVISSSIDINHSLKAKEKVMAINKALNSTQYINSIGGLELYEKKIFQKENIKLNFLKLRIAKYKQFNNEFIPYLSIIDIMMFNSKEEIKKMLLKYNLT